MSTEDEPVFFLARPRWWNLVGRYRWWRLKRDLRDGIYETVYYVPKNLDSEMDTHADD